MTLLFVLLLTISNELCVIDYCLVTHNDTRQCYERVVRMSIVACLSTLVLQNNMLLVAFITLFYIGYIDSYTYKIPNRLLVLLSVVPLVKLVHTTDRLSLILGGVASFIILYLTYVLSRQGVGLGDVKLLMVIGVYVGLHHILAILCVLCTVLVIGAICLLIAKKASLKTEIPMAPFIILCTMMYIQHQMLLVGGL